MEVQNVEHRHTNFGNSSPDLRSGALHMASVLVLLDCLEENSAKGAILNIGHLLGAWVVQNIVLHLDEVPVRAQAHRFDLCDAALASHDLIVDRNDVLLLLLELDANVMLLLPVNEHPIVAELVVEHLAEVC